jgi:hypothetical protein
MDTRRRWMCGFRVAVIARLVKLYVVFVLVRPTHQHSW